MISFRYHIVTIVSVFLALAVGVALGGGPLKGTADNSLVKQLATQKSQVAAQKAQLANLDAAGRFADSYAATTATTLLHAKLAHRSVAVITMPGADHAVAGDLDALILKAGGRVTASYAVGSKLGLVGTRPLVEELTSQMVATTKLAVPAAATGYQQLGALLGRAISDRTAGSAYDGTAQSIISGLSTAGLIKPVGQPAARADLVLVLAGPADPSDLGTAANQITDQVLGALVPGTRGLVLVGPAAAARAGGLLKLTRDDGRLSRLISTVDSSDTGPGQVVAVLALARRAAGTVGQWGAVDAKDGAMPGAAKP